MPKTLFRRTLLIIIVPLLLVQGITAYIFFDRHVETLTRRLSSSLVQEMDFVIDQLNNDNDFRDVKELARRYFNFEINILNNTLSARTKDLSEKNPILSEAINGQFKRPFAITAGPNENTFQVEIQNTNNHLLSFIIPEKRIYSSTTKIFILWMTGSTFVFFTIAIIFLRNQIRPISRLANAAENFGKGRDVDDFKPSGAHEVRQASQAFIKMKDKLTNQIQQRTEMLAGVSHDLRTPLTRINLALSLFTDRKTKSARDQKYIDEIHHDIKDMEQMIEAYLTFAKGEGHEKSELINVTKLFEEITLQTRRQYKNFSMNIKVDKNFELPLKKNALKRAIVNLINNGYQFADKVKCTLSCANHCFKIKIEDNGPGIPETEYENVFKPFYQIEAGKATDKNLGLGLPIAKDIVASHGGRIKLGRSKDQGLAIKIKLPL